MIFLPSKVPKFLLPLRSECLKAFWCEKFFTFFSLFLPPCDTTAVNVVQQMRGSDRLMEHVFPFIEGWRREHKTVGVMDWINQTEVFYDPLLSVDADTYTQSLSWRTNVSAFIPMWNNRWCKGESLWQRKGFTMFKSIIQMCHILFNQKKCQVIHTTDSA